MDVCCRCGLSYDECRYPLSHSHATVNHVDLTDEEKDIARRLELRSTIVRHKSERVKDVARQGYPQDAALALALYRRDAWKRVMV